MCTNICAVGLIFQSSILVFLVELLERNSALVAMVDYLFIYLFQYHILLTFITQTIEHIDKNVQEVENEEDSLIQRKDEDSVHGVLNIAFYLAFTRTILNY